MAQYEGDFTIVSVAGGKAGLGGSISHFHSVVGTPNDLAVRGQTLGLGVGVGVSIGASHVEYGQTGAYKKSYIGANGEVDIDDLLKDIRSGSGSPLGLWIPIYIQFLGITREEAAKVALELAIIHNSSPNARSCAVDTASLNINNLC